MPARLARLSQSRALSRGARERAQLGKLEPHRAAWGRAGDTRPPACDMSNGSRVPNRRRARGGRRRRNRVGDAVAGVEDDACGAARRIERHHRLQAAALFHCTSPSRRKAAPHTPESTSGKQSCWACAGGGAGLDSDVESGDIESLEEDLAHLQRRQQGYDQVVERQRLREKWQFFTFSRFILGLSGASVTSTGCSSGTTRNSLKKVWCHIFSISSQLVTTPCCHRSC